MNGYSIIDADTSVTETPEAKTRYSARQPQGMTDRALVSAPLDRDLCLAKKFLWPLSFREG